MTGFQTLFEKSMNEKKGITVFFDGQSVPGIVTEIGPNAIEMKSQNYSTIVVLISTISGVAIS